MWVKVSSNYLAYPGFISSGNLDILFVAPSLAFDSCIFALLLWGLVQNKAHHLGRLLLKDGFMYFVVVFISNTTWTVTGLTLQVCSYSLSLSIGTPSPGFALSLT